MAYGAHCDLVSAYLSISTFCHLIAYYMFWQNQTNYSSKHKPSCYFLDFTINA